MKNSGIAYSHVIFFLTGERDSGKTQLCEMILEKFTHSNLKITGVVSPGRYEESRKTGIFCMEIETGKRKVLAEYSPGWDKDNPKREWLFIPETLFWGNEVLGRSIPTDLLIIDEIGFLEFEKNSGWTNALWALESNQFHCGLAVIRPSLLQPALNRFPHAEVIKMNSIEDRESIADQLIRHFSSVLKG